MTTDYFNEGMVNRQRLLWAIATRRQLERWEPLVAAILNEDLAGRPLNGGTWWAVGTVRSEIALRPDGTGWPCGAFLERGDALLERAVIASATRDEQHEQPPHAVILQPFFCPRRSDGRSWRPWEARRPSSWSM